LPGEDGGGFLVGVSTADDQTEALEVHAKAFAKEQARETTLRR
jgi:hypothetical protein